MAQSAGGPGYYDRFRGRVLFSIRDTQDRPVGIGGRILPESGLASPAKYINSPETPLFSKGKLLYGLDVAREAIRKSRTALVMEGYTDCIVAHQSGFDNAVAVLGTALGPSHVQILKRFADRIVLVLDGDRAGQKRAEEVLELFIAENVDLAILTLPDETDPCQFLLERGAGAFADLHRSLLYGASWHKPDNYFVLLEMLPYIERKLQAIYDTRDPLAFGRKCLLNVAAAGKFSSDRTIRQYAEETWFIEPVPQLEPHKLF